MNKDLKIVFTIFGSAQLTGIGYGAIFVTVSWAYTQYRRDMPFCENSDKEFDASPEGIDGATSTAAAPAPVAMTTPTSQTV